MLAFVNVKIRRRILALGAAAAMAAMLAVPAFAFAEVRIDDTVINQGENAVGGGTATLTEKVLDMVNVVVDEGGLETDEDLNINFNGGNDLEWIAATGSANVTANFCGENTVDEFATADNASMTVNINGKNEVDEIHAYGDSNMTVNVTGENEFEEIIGYDNANITIRGTACQKKDIVNVDDGEVAILQIENGNLTIDHVTVNLKGSAYNLVGSMNGSMNIDTSKIKGTDAWTDLIAGKTMRINESVIDVAGEVYSGGLMTIKHSDVKASKPETTEDILPYRVYSHTGIELIDEKNGEVKEGTCEGQKVWYVDTDDNDGKDVDLKADGEPAYYRCSGDKALPKGMPKTGDEATALLLMLADVACMAMAAGAARRRKEHNR